jgi:hypothetical protein
MKPIHWIIAAAAFACVEPAQAGVNDPEVIIYRGGRCRRYRRRRLYRKCDGVSLSPISAASMKTEVVPFV